MNKRLDMYDCRIQLLARIWSRTYPWATWFVFAESGGDICGVWCEWSSVLVCIWECLPLDAGIIIEVVNLEMVLVNHVDGHFLQKIEKSEVSLLCFPFPPAVFKPTIFYNLRPNGRNLVALYLKFLSCSFAGSGSEAGPNSGGLSVGVSTLSV